MTRTLLFIVTNDDPHAEPARQYLLEALEASVTQVILAKSHTVATGYAVTEREATTVFFPVEQGLAGALLTARGSLQDQTEEILVVSDQLIGPLRDLQPLIEAKPLAPLRTLVRPESRDTYTESRALATAESAGDLAMELTWVQIFAPTLTSPSFWDALGPVADSSQGSENWLAVNAVVAAAERAGFANDVLYKVADETAANDFFGRSLPHYLVMDIPFMPWALFTTDPLYLERWAIIPRNAWDYLNQAGYPTDLFWKRLLRECPPQTWYTNLALLNICGDTTNADAASPSTTTNSLHTAVIAHVFYPDMLEEILHYANNTPLPADLFVTTDTSEKQKHLQQKLSEQSHFEKYEVRVVETNRGRDISAFLLDCADVLSDPRYDVIVKLHSKLSAQDPKSISAWFRNHLFENLLGTRAYAEQIWENFSTDPLLGMVFPPVIHMGVPTMGNGWTLNKGPAEQLAKRIGVDIPFDSFTPLSPYGSMFIARRAALETLAKAAFKASEFPDTEEYRDGSLAHVLERMFSYVVFSSGYYARCYQRSTMAEISATALQYKYDQVSHYLFPFAQRQIKMLSADGEALSSAEIRQLVQRQLSARYPRAGNLALGVWLRSRKVVSTVKKEVTRIRQPDRSPPK